MNTHRMKKTLQSFAGLILLAGFAFATPELTNTEATNIDTAPERTAWKTALELENVANVLSKYDAIVPPTVGDDSGDGYSIGSLWFNNLTGETYYCRDATLGIATWERIPKDANLGSMAAQNADSVTISGGTISNLANDLAIADGGTGASDAAAAAENLGLGITDSPTFAGASITGDLTVDTTTLKVDSANNRVGIGTASPAATCHIVTSAFNPIEIERSGIRKWQWVIDSSGGLGFRDSTPGISYLFLNTSGDVALGNNAPTTPVVTAKGTGTLELGASRSITFASNSGTWNGSTIAGDQTASGAWTFNGNLSADKTITAAATTGAQTINKNAGSVNFAAAATSLVVTNSRVTANSVIICTIGTNDATMTSVQAVAAAGSFTIYANAAPTAETRVNFLVIN